MARKPYRLLAVFWIAVGIQALGAVGAQAATWRCGSTYTDKPCPNGKPVDVEDPRSEADRRAADDATRRMEARSAQMERTRLKQDKDAAERDRKAAADARRMALAEQRAASAERLQQARLRKLASEPRKSTMKFKGPETRSP